MRNLAFYTTYTVGDETEILNVDDRFELAKITMIQINYRSEDEYSITFIFDKINYYNKTFAMTSYELLQNDIDYQNCIALD